MEASQTQKFILKLFSEIMVKGNKAKKQMIGQLFGNLKILLSHNQAIAIRKFGDKIEVVAPLEVTQKTRRILLDTSGIDQVLEAIGFDNVETLDQINTIVSQVVSATIENKTFVVRTKRNGKHPFSSSQISSELGRYLLENTNAKGVDLHTPEVTVRLELVNHQLNIITAKHQGLGGFPIGTQGEILSLMSGGFDSTVASYLAIKRGIKTHYLFFNLGGIAHEIGVKQVAFYLWNKFSSSHRVKFITVPFEDVVEEIFRSTSQPYMGVTLKRLMLIAAEKIADEMKIDAVMTGESVAQVSSQTLRNLALIDQATTKLVLRPLAMMNKPDIIAIADAIGTKKFAETMPEYCGVISKNPVIHGSFKRIVRESKAFDYDVLQTAVASAKTVDIHTIIEDINCLAPVAVECEITHFNQVIVDIRADEHRTPVPFETLAIAFHKLKSEFKKLPQDKEYLLYCDKGVLSQLHAQYLRDEGHHNLKVFRPKDIV